MVKASRDPVWYRDAVIYQLHVRTFHDGNGDGIGDFTGLTRRLDYFSHLGVTCLWLLPFYPSPLGDDGYDIEDYENVHPAYGSLADFKVFLSEAHARGLRVVTELVLNHTSDRHPWFQAARRGRPGSTERERYVWSDTPDKYSTARIIFADAEAANWTWDAVARAYYWHRFFHHQPDLNFDNEGVRREMLDVLRFWLDLGVDGLRLDAVPHLFEREGTSCENLPETHAFLRELRGELDRDYDDRVLIAEVNQPAAAARAYFGSGAACDECHMVFRFSLPPPLFLGLHRQDASPIVEELRRSPELPAGAQWATFLRNHDELSLSGLGTDDRGELAAMAPDASMRLHGDGIRRRLAPMLGDDPRRIELAYAILLALPGTPVVYYGDEVGLGDDPTRPDREGLRLPMPWNAPGTLFERMRALIATRRRHPALARGTMELLETGNPRVLALTRHGEDGDVMFAANLAASPEAASLGGVALGLDAFGYGFWPIVDGMASVSVLTNLGAPAAEPVPFVASPWTLKL